MSNLMNRTFGCLQDVPDRRDYPASMRLSRLKPILPSIWNLREDMTPVKDQGRLGSCVGFACAALKEWQEKEQRPWTPFQDSSEQWIYWKSKEIDPWPGSEGTSIRCALSILASKGVPPEGGWPYLDQASAGHRPPTSPKWWSYGVARWAKIGYYYRLSSLEMVKEWLVLRGPVVAGVSVGTTFFSPVDHVGCPPHSFVEIPRETIGGHAIVLVSYDDPLRIIGFKNSWGTDWGDRGFGFFSYEYLGSLGFDLWAILDF